MAAQLVVIDKSISGYQSLLSQIPSGYTILQVDSGSDGWGQIASYMSRQVSAGSGSSYSSLHIVGHGSSGSMQLGATTLNLGSLSSEATVFAQIQRYMTSGADLMLYGCDIGQGAAGNAFVTQLAKATGLDVAASTDATGGTGGDWVLEKTVGAVQAQSLSLVLEKSLLAGLNYQGTTGNDTLTGSPGDDSIDGGGGFDFVDYGFSRWSVTADLQTKLTSGGFGADRLSNVEGIIGSAYGDRLTGDGGNNSIRGGAGNDTLDGGDGRDTVDYETAGNAVIVDLAAGTASGGDGSDTLLNFENVRGSSGFADNLSGDGRGNRIEGFGGDDSLVGNAGNDTLDGGDGNDTISGGTGDDSIVSTSGNDVIDGGDGRDTLQFYAGAARVARISVSTLGGVET